MQLLHLQELPNICNIFEIIMTGIDNKNLWKDFWENKLHWEVLKEFPGRNYGLGSASGR